MRGQWGKRHDQPFHVVGSDACGVVLRAGSAVAKWKPGDRVLVHPNDVALEEPQGHDDAIQDPDQRVWGFESNYGGLGELCVAKGDQLMPKPEHLTWEEAACMPLVNCTAYRMLVSPNGAQMRQGDVVLIWGASGGLGGFALQYVLNGGGYPVCVVSSPEKAQKCREAGAEWVIDRAEQGFRFWGEDGPAGPEGGAAPRQGDPRADGRARPRHRLRAPRPRHLRRSVFVTRRGGKIVTCASTRLHARVRQPLPVDVHEDDRRLAPRELRQGLGANELCHAGRTHPILSRRTR